MGCTACFWSLGGRIRANPFSGAPVRFERSHQTPPSTMSTTPDSPPDEFEFTTLGPDANDYERYAQAIRDAGGVLLYDRRNEDAWIASDASVELPTVT